MAKPIRKREHKLGTDGKLPLSRINFIVILIGVLFVAAGYLAMLEGSVEGFLPIVVAPILLVLGYCVIIPLGILFKKSYFGSGQGKSNQPASNA